MEPIGLRIRSDGELLIVHRCLSCGKIGNNRIAGDDFPDAIMLLIHPLSDTRGMLTEAHISLVRDALYGRR